MLPPFISFYSVIFLLALPPNFQCAFHFGLLKFHLRFPRNLYAASSLSLQPMVSDAAGVSAEKRSSHFPNTT
jgi:hypothetical protein